MTFAIIFCLIMSGPTSRAAATTAARGANKDTPETRPVLRQSRWSPLRPTQPANIVKRELEKRVEEAKKETNRTRYDRKSSSSITTGGGGNTNHNTEAEPEETTWNRCGYNHVEIRPDLGKDTWTAGWGAIDLLVNSKTGDPLSKPYSEIFKKNGQLWGERGRITERIKKEKGSCDQVKGALELENQEVHRALLQRKIEMDRLEAEKIVAPTPLNSGGWLSNKIEEFMRWWRQK